jgi:hypothetical protein
MASTPSDKTDASFGSSVLVVSPLSFSCSGSASLRDTTDEHSFVWFSHII